MAADGSGPRRLTNDAAADQPSAWSSDRSRLLISSDRGGHDEIYVVNANGSAPKRLAASKIPASGAHWSPDGTTVVFNADTSGSGCYQVFSMRADGSSVKQLTSSDTGCNWSPVWSPRGDRIAFSTNRDGNFNLSVMKPDGSAQTRITTDIGLSDGFPVFSPDGRQLLFTSWNDAIDSASAEVSVVDVDGSNRKQLTTNHVEDSYPTWSPDGTSVAFQTNRDGNFEIYTMLPDGSLPTRVTNDPADDTGAVWR